MLKFIRECFENRFQLGPDLSVEQGKHWKSVRATFTGLGGGTTQYRTMTVEHPLSTEPLDLCLYHGTVCYINPEDADVGKTDKKYKNTLIISTKYHFVPERSSDLGNFDVSAPLSYHTAVEYGCGRGMKFEGDTPADDLEEEKIYECEWVAGAGTFDSGSDLPDCICKKHLYEN